MADMSNRTVAGLMKDLVVARLNAGQLSGWEFKLGKIPSTPDKIIAFVDQGGQAAFPHMLTDFPGLQILVRGGRGGNGYQDGYLMIRLLRDTILGHPGQPPEFVELTSVTERGHIVPLGYDDADRHTWSSNYQLIVEPGANAITYRTPM